MIINRIIPCLLLKNKGLVKSIKFKDYTYIGDPINAVKIFNEKEVDELIFLDIDATNNKMDPPYKLIENIASECFMPFCYGGGINNIEQISKIIKSGAEKIAINTKAFEDPKFIEEAVKEFGSSTIVVSIDYKKNFLGKYQVYTHSGKKNTNMSPVEYAKKVEQLGAGEIFLNSIEKDGTMTGYDIEQVQKVSTAVGIPIIASGGAGSLSDIEQVLTQGKASAAAAGSFFVFQGRHRAVLISYPAYGEISKLQLKNKV